jgi:regulator of RNase E activity RraA
MAYYVSVTMAPEHDSDFSARCRQIATATWSDALDSLRIHGVMDGIEMRSGDRRIAGPAMTVEERVAPLGSYELSQFDVGGIIRATPPGFVTVISMNGETVSTFGGLAAKAVAASQIAGVVIDGGCRDLAEIEATGIYLASRHVTPRSGKNRVRVIGFGQPVRCGGVDVHSGDYVVADETGVIVIPREQLEETIRVAEGLSANDRKFEVELAAGRAFGDVAARLHHV